MTGTGALLAVVGAGAAALALRQVLRAGVHPAWVATGLLLPVAWILGDENWRIHSHHGLLHSAIVYAILDRGAPPENPLLAGHALGYPFGHHWLLANLMRAVPVAPPWLFAATNLLCVAGAAWLLDRTARLFSADRVYRVLVIVLALYGSNPFSLGLPVRALYELGFQAETRLPPLFKFMTLNSSPLGIGLLALTIYGIALLFQREEKHGAAMACVTVGYVGVGLAYPVAWWSVAGCMVAATLVLALTGGRAKWARALGLLLVVGALPLIPWFSFLAAERAVPAYPQLSPSLGHGLRKLLTIALAAGLPVALLIGCRWRQLVPAPASTWLALSTCGLALAYGIGHLEIHSEYWLLMSAQIPLAFGIADPLRSLLARRPLVGWVVLSLILAPAAWFLSAKLSTGWSVADPATTSGHRLVHRTPAERALHDWLGEHTAPDAVLVDTHLSLPALARRALFVGLDEPRSQQVDTNGIGLSARRWLYNVHGRDPVVIDRRAAAAAVLVGTPVTGTVADALTTVRAEVPRREVWAVARSSEARSRLSAHGLAPAFDNEAATVFRLSATPPSDPESESPPGAPPRLPEPSPSRRGSTSRPAGT